MAKKDQPIIVIKKVIENPAGHHGGSWKVAFADFMTALMAFFLVMWLVSQSEEIKKEVANHFSTPSVVEYNFKNYGVLLTLEKLFTDLVNDPLEFLQSFIRPMDHVPNVMNMGSEKVVEQHLIQELGTFTKNIQTNTNLISFDIPDYHLFEHGTSKTSKGFVQVISKIQGLTTGLQNSDINIDSSIHLHSISIPKLSKKEISKEERKTKAQYIAEERMDIISRSLQETLESPTVDVYGKSSVFVPSEKDDNTLSETHSEHKYSRWIRIEIQRKDVIKKEENQMKDSKFKRQFKGGRSSKSSIYDRFVKKLSKPDKPVQLEATLGDKEVLKLENLEGLKDLEEETDQELRGEEVLDENQSNFPSNQKGSYQSGDGQGIKTNETQRAEIKFEFRNQNQNTNQNTQDQDIDSGNEFDSHFKKSIMNPLNDVQITK